jgi:hypothetical protein
VTVDSVGRSSLTQREMDGERKRCCFYKGSKRGRAATGGDSVVRFLQDTTGPRRQMECESSHMPFSAQKVQLLINICRTKCKK